MEIENLTDEEFETVMNALQFWAHPLQERRVTAVKLMAKITLMQYHRGFRSNQIELFSQN